jgi:hypothetical protein
MPAKTKHFLNDLVWSGWKMTDPIHDPYYINEGLDWQWIADNGWQMIFDPGNALFQPPFDPTLFDKTLEQMTEYGIKSKLMLNGIFNYWAGATDVGPDTLTTYYENKYGAAIDYLEAQWGPHGEQGDTLNGYWYETTYDTGALWIRNKTDLEIRWGIGAENWMFRNDGQSPIGPFGPNQGGACMSSLDYRMTLVDAVDLEVWAVDDMFSWQLIQAAQYFQENYPNMSLGIDSMCFMTPPYNSYLGKMWTWYRTHVWPAYAVADPLPTVDQSIARAGAYLNYIKNQLARPFDNIMAEVCYYVPDHDNIFNRVANWNDVPIENFNLAAYPQHSPPIWSDWIIPQILMFDQYNLQEGIERAPIQFSAQQQNSKFNLTQQMGWDIPV